MENKLTFEKLVEFLKERHSDLVDLIDVFTSGTSLIVGFAIGPGTVGLADTISILSDVLGVKDKFSELGRRLLTAVGSRIEQGTLPRLIQLQLAYSLLSYTAFFEAIEQLLPTLSRSIDLLDRERHWLVSCAHAVAERRVGTMGSMSKERPVLAEQALGKLDLELPHPTSSYQAQCQQLRELYIEMARGFFLIVESLTMYEQADEAQRREIMEAIKALPEVSLVCFDAQYVNLAKNFPEFWIWSNLHEHQQARTQMDAVTAEVRAYAQLVEFSQQQIDLGFQVLDATVHSAVEQILFKQVHNVLTDLSRLYKAAVDEPVISDTGASGDDVSLTYPRREEIFVPQAFKTLRYSRGTSLENENTWRGKGLEDREELGPFLLRYLSSPYSYITPLIILGQPGSGKSLLTRMLAAHLENYTCIRVELRNINADQELYALIQEQIERTTQGRTISWPTIMEHTEQRPALVILDGYDELLQANGQIFANFLQRVAEFQNRELQVRGLPVRVIVTSRVTLIDKAYIPDGSTIVRLLEFDESRQQRWIEVWNSTNRTYFTQHKIEPFVLPRKDQKIADLASQPLLLLMLAIYDSLDNRLRIGGKLDRTELYDSLLRRFIRRERRKDPHLDDAAIEELIEADMLRLGVTALGMHNRSKVSITNQQLNKDLSFFTDILEVNIPLGPERRTRSTGGRWLEAADKVLGSFFFVQESQAVYGNEDKHDQAVETAFEFLHKTFGEFLTADFIVRAVLEVVRPLHRLRRDKEIAELRDKLSRVDSPRKSWFAALSFVPLYTAPEALSMLREWLPHRLEAERLRGKDFFDSLDTMIYAQVGHMLNSTTFPAILTGAAGSVPYESLPLLGYIAIYTLNLIIMRAWLTQDEFRFDQTAVRGVNSQGVPIWSRLIHIWQAWLPRDALTQLSPLLSVTYTAEDENVVKVASKPGRSQAHLTSNEGVLEQILVVSETIGDVATGTLAELNLLYHLDLSIMH